jgi:hypothetical protein
MTKAHEVYPISSPRCRVSAPGHGETISRPPAFDGGAQRGDKREGCAGRDSGAAAGERGGRRRAVPLRERPAGKPGVPVSRAGGRPSNRYSLLEHTWTFNVQPATTLSLLAEVQTDAADGEAFNFAYSTDGQRFADMFSVTVSSSAQQSYALPAGMNGTVYVRVSDTQHSPGVISSYRVAVDQLLIRSESASGDPPAEPTNATTEALSSSQIALEWRDNATDEYGFKVERTSDGGATWSLAASLPAKTVSR